MQRTIGICIRAAIQIAGDDPRLREPRTAGAPICNHELPPEQAPSAL